MENNTDTTKTREKLFLYFVLWRQLFFDRVCVVFAKDSNLTLIEVYITDLICIFRFVHSVIREMR